MPRCCVTASSGPTGSGRSRAAPASEHIANRLVADGQGVVDVPAKLSVRARVFATGQGRKTDATDAHSGALGGTRMTALRPVINDEQLAVLRILADRRWSLDHTRMVSQLHQWLLELIPGGATKDLSARQAKALLAKVPPPCSWHDPSPRRRGSDQRPGADLRAEEGRQQGAHRAGRRVRHRANEPARDGPSGTARLLVAVGDITRFRTRPTSRLGTAPAPIDASSGDQAWHRLSRGGNRQINRVLHIMARVQIRNPSEGRDHYEREKADGKAPMEGMRCVRRRLFDIVYQQMLNDAPHEH